MVFITLDGLLERYWIDPHHPHQVLLRYFRSLCLSTYTIEHYFSQILFNFPLHLTMSPPPPVGTPGTISVTNLIASMQHGTINAPTPAAVADLQGTQLLYYEGHISGPSPAVKVEREGGLGTFVLWGGYQWCDIGASLPGKLTRVLFLGRIGLDRLCLLQA
jgi:hypothetical protein